MQKKKDKQANYLALMLMIRQMQAGLKDYGKDTLRAMVEVAHDIKDLREEDYLNLLEALDE